MNQQERIRELRYRLLEVIPHKRSFEVEELRKFVWDNTKGLTFSEEEFYEAMALLLNGGDLKPLVFCPRYQVVVEDGKRRILVIESIGEVFRPM